MYLRDTHSSAAIALAESQPRLWLTPLHIAECFHAFAQQVYFGRIAASDAERLCDQLNQDRADNIWSESPIPERAFDVCAALARRYGPKIGVPTLDSLHVACALELGADHVVVSSDPAQMAAAKGTLNAILDTVAASHDLNPYLRTLDLDGALIQLGLPENPMPSVDTGLLIRKRLAYGGSLIGGIAETQEMLDFCAEHGIVSDIEMVTAAQLDQAYDRMVAGDVKYRFVLDNSTL